MTLNESFNVSIAISKCYRTNSNENVTTQDFDFVFCFVKTLQWLTKHFKTYQQQQSQKLYQIMASSRIQAHGIVNNGRLKLYCQSRMVCCVGTFKPKQLLESFICRKYITFVGKFVGFFFILCTTLPIINSAAEMVCTQLKLA